MAFALGIEIGGTKLQAGIGDGGQALKALVRRPIDVRKGGAGIREAIPGIVEEALKSAGMSTSDLAGVGVGFGVGVGVGAKVGTTRGCKVPRGEGTRLGLAAGAGLALTCAKAASVG